MSPEYLNTKMKHYPIAVHFSNGHSQWSVRHDIYAPSYGAALVRLAHSLKAAKRANDPYGLPQLTGLTSCNMTTQHSPLPWSTRKDSVSDYLFDNEGNYLGHTGSMKNTSEQNTQNAQFIVTAVNSHAALVEALDNARKAMEMARQCGQFPDFCLEAIADARAALSLAKGGK